MPVAPTQWNDALEKRFLLEIIALGGANATTFGEIAKKWGGSHTKGSLNMKFQRMKKAYAKENEGEEGGSDSVVDSEGAKKSPTKRKAGDDGGKSAKKTKAAQEGGVKLEATE